MAVATLSFCSTQATASWALADPDVKRLARPDDVGKGFHRLLERSEVVVAVGLVEIHVVGLQSTQRGVDRLVNVLAGQAGVVRTLRAGGEIDLGEDLQALPAFAGQCVTEDALGLAVRVYVGGVEGGDARLQRSASAGRGLVRFDL